MQHLRFSELHGTREVMKCKVNGGHRYDVGSYPTVIGIHSREGEKEVK
jgi:hypothetical protein